MSLKLFSALWVCFIHADKQAKNCTKYFAFYRVALRADTRGISDKKFKVKLTILEDALNNISRTQTLLMQIAFRSRKWNVFIFALTKCKIYFLLHHKKCVKNSARKEFLRWSFFFLAFDVLRFRCIDSVLNRETSVIGIIIKSQLQ